MSPHVSAQEYTNPKFQTWPKHLPFCQSYRWSTSSPPLDLNLFSFHFSMGVPNGRSIFELRPDQGIVGGLSHSGHLQGLKCLLLSDSIYNLKFHKNNKTWPSRRCVLRPDFPVTSLFFTAWTQGQSFISF